MWSKLLPYLQRGGGGGMPQFCILFYADYTILTTQRGGMAQCSPKYAPVYSTIKIKTSGLWKKCFHVLFHVMITNEVSVTILQAYFSLPRHIRKGMLMRWIITSDLCKAVGCQQFRKESRKLQRRIMFERNYSFYHHCSCIAVTWCSKNSNLSKPKWGGTSIR